MLRRVHSVGQLPWGNHQDLPMYRPEGSCLMAEQRNRRRWWAGALLALSTIAAAVIAA
jgi:hypothetical protein